MNNNARFSLLEIFVALYFFALIVDSSCKKVAISQDLLSDLDTDIGSLSYNDLHTLLVSNQHDNYLKSILSLGSRQHVRSLNGMFDFCFDSNRKGFQEHWFSKSLSDSCRPDNFYRMPVPSAFNEILASTDALNYMGWFWYQTSISSLALGFPNVDGKVILQFESINYLALIYVQRLPKDNNASLVGTHVGGHLPISIDLSQFSREHITDEADTTGSDDLDYLRVTIAVSNMLTDDTIPSGRMVDLSHVVGREYKQFQPDFDFFHFAGIMGDVNLIRLPSMYIENVQQAHGNPKDSFLTFDVFLNTSSASKATYYKLDINSRELFDYDFVAMRLPYMIDYNETIYLKEGRAPLSVRISLTRELQYFRCNMNPNYKFKVSLLEKSRKDSFVIVDRFELKLNCPQVPDWTKLDLHGFGMHQEQLFSGRAMSLPAIMKDIYLLKRTGANVIRTSHYPYSPAYLDACDEHGIMVIAECPAVGLKSFSKTKLLLHKQILREMMWRDQHHPSIIMWSIANEPESQHEEARIYFKSLLDYARKDLANFTIHAHRPLTAAIAQSHDADLIGHMLDVIMINRYYAWYDYTSALATIRPALLASLNGWAGKHPGKALMISEFGADTLAGLHKTTRGIYTEEFQRDLIAEHEKVFLELRQANSSVSNINFIGSMIWNFADFSTHESLLRIGGINRKGVFTREREPKMAINTVHSFYSERSDNNIRTMYN